MKTIYSLIFCLLFSNVFSQDIEEKEIKTDVNEVTVFLDGAQISRKKSLDLIQGKVSLKFVNLSPFIDPKSVQVKTKGDVMVLSVNHHKNYIAKLEKPLELKGLEEQKAELDMKIELENTYLEIIKEELAFLQKNSNLGGKDQALSAANLIEASNFHSSKISALKLKELERKNNVQQMNKTKKDIENQIRTLSDVKEYSTGEILVNIDVKRSSKIQFELSYLVGNVSWYPSYDIRAKNINEPVEVVYKANLKQDTKVDWENVKLRFSSSNPSISGVSPELKPYFLNYNTLPPVYNKLNNQVSGVVMDNNHMPLPGANISVTGTSIGTASDMNGNYSISIPGNAISLTFSYIGFENKTMPIYGSKLNAVLEESIMSMDEVIVVGYGGSDKSSNTGWASDVYKSEKKGLKSSDTIGWALPVLKLENQTTVDFEIDVPYSVKSNNKNTSVDMVVYNLPADYQYYCMPKANKNAFLIANITDWEKYNLLEGEANIFFEDTYIGKSLLDIRFADDTLQVSLGIDKSISINREKKKGFVSKQFIGTKKEESKAWLTTIKNNKNQNINIRVLDQVPVSTIDEIEVKIQNISGAKFNSETGAVSWEFELSSGDKKELELNYSVKYPKSRTLIIE